MKITSNVCDIELSGTHTFDNVFSYHLKIPFKNLSKKKQTEANTQAKEAIDNPFFGKTNVFIIIEGKGDQFEVKYDKTKVGQKIKEDLKKEKEELIKAFKNETPEIKHSKVNEEEFFDFD